MTNHLGLVLHVQEGNNSLYGWFNNPDSNASSTWWVSKSGTIEQYVSENYQAWAQASGNATYNSVETEGYVSEYLTQQQLDSIADIYEWGHNTFGWPYSLSGAVGQKGFAWHGMGGSSWGGHTGCPGDIRKSQMSQILQIASGGPTSPPVKPPTTTTPPPVKGPAFPYPSTDYLGTTRSDPHCHSGYNQSDQPNIRTWQQQMKNRGWSLSVDGLYGNQSAGVCTSFQREKGLSADGLVGPQTWGASWTAPIT